MTLVLPKAVSDWLNDLSSRERAELAGQVLTDVDPILGNLLVFWEELDESVRDELVARLATGELE